MNEKEFGELCKNFQKDITEIFETNEKYGIHSYLIFLHDMNCTVQEKVYSEYQKWGKSDVLTVKVTYGIGLTVVIYYQKKECKMLSYTFGVGFKKCEN